MDAYVNLIEKSIEVVLKDESYLFTIEELSYFKKFQSLYYHHKLVLSRLLNRQPKKWYRLNRLDFSFNLSEIIHDLLVYDYDSSLDGDLFRAIGDSLDIARINGDDESWSGLNFIQSNDYLELPYVSVDYLLTVLNNEELLKLSKKLNCTPKQVNQATLIKYISDFSRNQSTLTSNGNLFFNSSGQLISQSFNLKKSIFALTGNLVRINPPIHNLFNRLAFVYSRQSVLFSPPHHLLSSFGKRHYPQPNHIRTLTFDSRSSLIEFINALNLESEFDIAFESKDYITSQSIALSILNKWRLLINSVNDMDIKKNWRLKYSSGHIYTRLVFKLSSIFSKNKNYVGEVELLRELLNQRVWRIGKRGAYYNRLALVLMTHFKSTNEEKYKFHYEALKVCYEALSDPDTHEIYKFDLSRRLTRLEKSKILEIPIESRNSQMIDLKSPSKVFVRGERCYDTNNQHSLWRALIKPTTESPHEVLRVEEFTLQYYNLKGWKGLHNEGKIVRTIFVLALWDIIFDKVEGAFETPFQIAPLDLNDGGDFYRLRKDSIENRLSEIKLNGATKFVEERYDLEFERRTWAIGVNWDYKRDDLINLTNCLGGSSLSQIFRVLCQDWEHRTGGMPDLMYVTFFKQ